MLWRAKDCEWSMRERVVALGEEFGPAGPMVLDWLEEQAKKQRGTVLTGFRAVARGAFLRGGAEEAESIVTFAATIGAVDDFEVLDGQRFRCRVSGFSDDQRLAQAAARQQTRRDRDGALPSASERDGALPSVTKRDSEEGNGVLEPKQHCVTQRDGALLSVTSTRVTGQDRKEQKNTVGDSSPTTPLVVGEVKFDRRPVPPDRLELAKRILIEFNRQAGTAYEAFTRRGKPSEDLRRIIGALTDAVPALDFDEATRMIEAALLKPYWEGRPHTGVVFGPKVISRYREQAKQVNGSGSLAPFFRSFTPSEAA
jgi:hypothetical protein